MHSLGGSGWSSAFTCPCSRDCMWSGQLSVYIYIYIYIYIAQGLYGGVHRCALIEEDLELADAEGFTSRALIYERGSLSLFCLSPPRNETRSTLEYTSYPVGAPQITLNTSKRALEGVCTSCTNQAHYSLVCMCTPCTKPHPPPLWWSRSRVVVTSYHVLIGSATGAAHTHTWSTYTYVGIPYASCATSPSCLSLIPLWLNANFQMTPSLLLPTWYASLCTFYLVGTSWTHATVFFQPPA